MNDNTMINEAIRDARLFRNLNKYLDKINTLSILDYTYQYCNGVYYIETYEIDGDYGGEYNIIFEGNKKQLESFLIKNVGDGIYE